MSRRAEHCGGFRTVKGRMVEVHGRACRSSDGMCACPCARCKKARTCKHDGGTFLSIGSMTPFMPEMRFETGHGRAKREDDTDYVGPVVKVRRVRPDEPTPKTVEWKSETCIACGMRIRGTKVES
jgi:hypothetical protein